MVRFHRYSPRASLTSVLILPVSDIVLQAGIQCSFHNLSGMLHKILRFSYIHKTSGNDIRTCENYITVALQCHNYDHDPIFRKVLTVTKYDISHITNAKSVYEDRTCMNASCHLGILSVQLQNISGRRIKIFSFGIPRSSTMCFCAVR